MPELIVLAYLQYIKKIKKMPELIVLACFYNNNQKKMPELIVLAFLYVRPQKQPEYFQVKQVGSGQSRLPNPT
jgi:hypothetical protein